MLKFLGNGAGFSKTHNGAMFDVGKDTVVFIDCSLLNIEKIYKYSKGKKTYMFITHMHADHVSGLGIYIQYMYYVLKQAVTLCMPYNLVTDMETFLSIQGITADMYDIMCITDNIHDNHGLPFKVCSVLVEHAPELRACFGYVFELEDERIVYSGDTNDISPYYPYLTVYDGRTVDFYVDISVSYGQVHLKYSDAVEKLREIVEKFKANIYLMHVDDLPALRVLVRDEPFEVAEVVD